VTTLSPFVVLRPANHAPSAIASGRQRGGHVSGRCQRDSYGSGTDPDAGDILSFCLSEGATTLGTAATITMTLSVGIHNLTFTVPIITARRQPLLSLLLCRTLNHLFFSPGNQMLEATSPAGAIAAFSANATDIVDGVRPVICSPPSGSTFRSA